MKGILPEAIRTRTHKTFFTSVFDTELQRRWSDYQAVFGPGATPEIARRGYIDQERFWMRLEAGRGGADLPDALYVVRMIGLESWLRATAKSRPTAVTVAEPRSQPISTQPHVTVSPANAGIA